MNTKIKEHIDHLQNLKKDLDYRIEVLGKLGDILKDIPDLNVSSYPDTIDFDDPTRKQAVAIMEKLGAGKWDKDVLENGRLEYTNTTLFPGIRIRLWSAEPPPSCKIVEYEEVIPAHQVEETKIKKYKLVCNE